MDGSGIEDATDFRPFFDMVIGILFVLLILVAAQVYFAQAQDETTASEAVKREAALRRADIAAFLGTLADRLRAGGLDATVDAGSGAVLVPLGQVLTIDARGLPSVGPAPAARLGAVLSGMAACVTDPRSAAQPCPTYARLSLDALAVTARVGALPPGAALARARFGDLGSALLSAAVLSDEPSLIGASNPAGGRVVTFGSALAGAGAPLAGVGGDLALDFTFE